MFGHSLYHPLAFSSSTASHHSHLHHTNNAMVRSGNSYQFISNKHLLDDLYRFVVHGIGDEHGWNSFLEVFKTVSLSFSIIRSSLDLMMKHLEKVDKNTKHWSRCADLIALLPHYCKNLDELIKVIIPTYSTVMKELYLQTMDFVDAIIQKFIPNIGPKNFWRLLNASHGFIAKQLAKRTNHHSFNAILFPLIDKFMQDKDFNSCDTVLTILNYYFKHAVVYNQQRYDRELYDDMSRLTWDQVTFKFNHVKKTIKHDIVVSMLQTLVQKGADTNKILELITSRPGVESDLWIKYSTLLIALSERHADKTIIRHLLKKELVDATVIPEQKVPTYRLIPIGEFGNIFYSLAKHGLLPKIKYTHVMREAVFRHIETLPIDEKTTAMLAIKNHENNQISDFFWHKSIFLCCQSNPYVLHKHWQERIDQALATKEQNSTSEMVIKPN